MPYIFYEVLASQKKYHEKLLTHMFLVLNKIATEGQNFKMVIKSGIIEAAGEALNQKGIKKELAL